MLQSNISRLFIVLLFYYLEEVSCLGGFEKVLGEPGVNSKVDHCTSISTANGDFEKISPSSKYLLFRGNSDVDDGWIGDEAGVVCDMVEQLEIAEVTNTFDLQSLEKHIFSSVWIGLNHKNTPGVFTEARGSPIKFQSFFGVEPNNLEMSERCVMLSPAEGGYLAMEDASCTSVKAGALCQFKKGSSCFLQSAEETTSSSSKKAEVASLAVGSRFFVSTLQKPWSAAFEACMTNGLQLITLDDDDINQELADQIKKRLAEQHLHPATQFWSGGILQDNTDLTASRLAWIVGEDSMLPAVDLVPHQWAKATPDAFEPFDQSGSGVENCLDISFENTELASTGSYAPLWRTSNCFLPKFFICERVPLGVPEETIRSIVDEQLKEEGDITEDGLEGRSESIRSCGELHVDPINFEIDITRPQTEQDIIKFLIFNVEHDLKSGKVPYEVKESIKWKENVINLLIKIVQKSVDTTYVDHGLLNVVKILILMYFNAIPDSSNSTRNEQLWTDIYVRHLQECLKTTQKMELSGTGFEIGFYTTDDDNSVPIEVPEEHADKIENLDSAIDILWYMFSFSVGSCYTLPKDKIGFASDFHVAFIADFIHDLREKWTINVEIAESTRSRGLDYSLALGDFDFMQSFRNLRYLVSAAYIKSDVKDLQLVRPLDMTKIYSDSPMPQENAKTGNSLELR